MKDSFKFKLWLEAFAENIDLPNHAQWQKIKAELSAVSDGNSFTEKELIERYFRAEIMHSLGSADHKIIDG